MAETIFGLHAIEEFLKRGKTRGTLLVSREGARIAALCEHAEACGVRVSHVSDADLVEASGSEAHKGAVLVLELPSTALHGDFRRSVDQLTNGGSLFLPKIAANQISSTLWGSDSTLPDEVRRMNSAFCHSSSIERAPA